MAVADMLAADVGRPALHLQEAYAPVACGLDRTVRKCPIAQRSLESA